MVKKSSIALISIIMVAVIGVSLFFALKPQIPIGEAILSECTSTIAETKTVSFTCPNTANVTSCNAILKLTCNQQSGTQPRAIARTDDNDFSIGWLAYDNQLGGMASYIFDSEVYYSGNPPGTKNNKVTSGFVRNVFIDGINGRIYVYKASPSTSTYYGRCQTNEQPSCPLGPETESSRGRERCTPSLGGSAYKNYVICNNPTYYRYRLGSGANTNSAPQSACEFPEVCSDDSIYNCNIPYTISGGTSGSVTCSGTAACTAARSINLNKGQIVNYNPASPNTGNIEATTTKTFQSECTKDQPVPNDKSSYRVCVENSLHCGILGEEKECPDGQVFRANDNPPSCGAAFEVIVTKPTKIQVGEPIIVNVDVNDPTDENLLVTVSVVGKSISDSAYTNSRGIADFNIPNTLSPGFYELLIKVDRHPDGIYDKKFSFEVIRDIELIIETDRPTQFDNQPIQVIGKVYQNGQLSEVGIPDFEAIWKGNTIKPTRVTPANGLYTALFDIEGSGIFRARFRLKDFEGTTTPWTDYKDIEIQRASIIIVTDFQSGSGICSKKTYTNKFKTTDNDANLIATNNKVTLFGSGIGSNGQVMQVSEEIGKVGEYSFTYLFESAGLYTVKIDSNADAFGTTSLNGGDGGSITINSCGTTDGLSPLWYLVIFGGITAIVVVFMFIRKKKK